MDNNNALRVGPLWFTPGVTGVNLATMLFAAFGTMATVSFMSFMQPYVFNELLHIPEDEQGRLTGNLHAFQEVVFITIAGLVGAISDKLGRPPVYAAGFLVTGLGYALYPLAGAEYQLYIVRGIFAVGVAGIAIMLSACTVDYIQERSRGRWLGTTSLCNGLGILAMSFLLSQLPRFYQDNGATNLDAGRFSFWTVAAIAVFIAFIMYVGLFRGGNKEASKDHIFRQFFQGLRLGIRNPRLSIAYGGAFIGRGDFAVIGTFFSLWMVQEGLEQGKTTAEALAIAGPLFGLIQGCAVLWAPVMGFICDRVHRLLGVTIGLALAGGGYISMSMIDDPYSTALYPAAVLLGMGETGVIVSVGVLLGQEARGEYRGAIVGVFGQLGGLGILVTSLGGGYLFDGVGRTAPFFMMGLLNFVLLAAALLVYFSNHRDNPDLVAAGSGRSSAMETKQ